MYDLQEMKERIKKLKNELGFTNESLAAKAGIPYGTLNKMLGSETKDPQISTIIKIAKALNVSADFLILGDNSDQQDIKPGILIKYNSLNNAGQRKVDEYIDDLLVNPLYTDSSNDISTDISNEIKQSLGKKSTSTRSKP